MQTPICDFVNTYAAGEPLRLHMPGHKGCGILGVEQNDITEVAGADSLYEAAGIIRESEENASALFGCPTYYSTEGSSQCIRAMLYLAMLWAKEEGKTPLIAAARNVHKTFLSGAALLDLPVRWLYGHGDGSYLSCRVTAAEVEALFSAEEKPAAVYLTSPDYLGHMAEAAAIAEVCHRNGALLLVDNAHGAYLKFLPESRHPIDLGADLCCDSAHKTLPVLTGGAYLHIANDAPAFMTGQAKNALTLFGSTSPSYLILQSLDAANPILEQLPAALTEFLPAAEALSRRLRGAGYSLVGEEALKITIAAKAYGCTGEELADALRQSGIEPEFADRDFTVLMLTPSIGKTGIARVEQALTALPRRAAIAELPPQPAAGERVLSIREAMLSPAENIPAAQSAGRILAAASVGCPPAVPIAVCGERLTKEAAAAFGYYGIDTVTVVKE